MNFTDAVKTCFNKYVTFSGRATRPEYWYFVLFVFIVALVLGVIDNAMFVHIDPVTQRPTQGPLGLIFTLAIILPSIAVGVRRLHDIDKSGWWYLINIIPIVGPIVFIIFACTKGTEGPNKYDLPMSISGV